MRGPGLRASLDVRRLWRCPQCGYERRAPGWETTVRCHCNSQELLMSLVEPRRVCRPESAPPDLFFEYEPTPEELEAEAAARAAREAARRELELARHAEQIQEPPPSPAPEEAEQKAESRVAAEEREGDEFASGLDLPESEDAENDTADSGEQDRQGPGRRKRRHRRRRGKKPNS